VAETKNKFLSLFEEAAKAMNQSSKDAKKNTRELLERVLSAKEERNDKNWKP
jgi:hypothetical protein